MKNIIFCSIIISVFFSCSITHKHYLGTLENIKYVVSHEDSLKIDRSKTDINKGSYCFEMENHAEFRGGTSAFRQSVYENFKVPKKAKSGENTILVTIGKQNNLEKVEILKYNDEEKKSLLKIFLKVKHYIIGDQQNCFVFL